MTLGISPQARARAYETTITIPTYELLADDHNPIFDKMHDPYPYTMQNHVSKQRIDKIYTAVVLENIYLRLTVLPELGGRLFSAVDKRTDREFLYRNTVIQPRLIGTRGAWFSGGIEYNFPISHAPTSSARVNCTTREYEDGSAAIVFGGIETMSFMNWKVELRLYPEKSYMEQNVSLSNPTPRENKYYFWTNTAVEYNPSLQLIYPFDWSINFDQKYVKWPYYKQMDCRNPREIAFSYETFGKLTTGDFFGVYNRDAAYGVVHYANRKLLKGAKFFIWGNDRNAKAWNRCLTDNDAQYIEIQSGPYETQGVYKFMRPYQQLAWSEYWYPVFGMDGFRHAAKEVVLQIEPTERGADILLLANEPLPGCRLIWRARGQSSSATLDLTPDRVVRVEAEIEAEGDVPLHEWQIDLYSAEKHIVNFGQRQETTDEYPDTELYEDSRVRILNEDPDKLLKHAMWRESFGMIAQACEYYERNLAANPSCAISRNRLGQLQLKRMQYEQAETCFRQVLAYDNRNGQARFYMAVASKEQGRLQRARRLFMDIAADSDYYQASVVELIKIDLQLGYYQEAQAMSELLSDGGGSYGYVLAAIANRKDGLRLGAERLLGRASDADEHVLAESYLLHLSEEAKQWLTAFTGGDEAALLPIALDYADMGFCEEAEAILRLIANPTLKTKLAFGLVHQAPEQREAAMLQALDGGESLDRVFLKERLLLQALENLRDKDATGSAHYMLGTFYCAVGRKDDALDALLLGYGCGLRHTALLHSIGYIYMHHNQDSDEAEVFFTEDVAVHGSLNEDSLLQLDRIYRQRGDLEKRKALAPYMERAANKTLVLVALVNIWRDTGEEEKALQLLENEPFDNWEGQDASGRCYRDFIVHMAAKEVSQGDFAAAKRWMERARTYPETLHYGEPTDVVLSEIYYWTGIVHAGLGEESLALEAFRQGVREWQSLGDAMPAYEQSFAAQCVKELQKRELVL